MRNAKEAAPDAWTMRAESQYNVANTLRFTAWNGEEIGRDGSYANVHEAQLNSESIALNVNFDSEGYDPYRNLILDIMYNADSTGIAALMNQRNILGILRQRDSLGETDIERREDHRLRSLGEQHFERPACPYGSAI